MSSSGSPGPSPPSSPKVLGDKIVSITVGTAGTAKVFYLHKQLLCSKVRWFDTAFNGPFSEAMSQSAALEEDDPSTFEIFTSWVYFDMIQLPHSSSPQWSVRAYVYLYAFADKYGITTLADETMNALIHFLAHDGESLDPTDIVLAFELVPPNSKMRQFAAKMFVFILLDTKDSFEDGWSVASLYTSVMKNEDLLFEMMKLLKGHSGRFVQDPRIDAGCKYHSHPSDGECPYAVTSGPVSPPTTPVGKKKPSPKKRRRY